MTSNRGWKWSYFVEINDEAKCILCGKKLPTISSVCNAYHHLRNKHRSEYEKTKNKSKDSSEYWKNWFTTENNTMKCKLCNLYKISLVRYISLSMTRHIKTIHKIDENKAIKIITYMSEEIYDRSPENKHICKKCDYTFPDDKNITLLKHMMNNHLSDIPAESRPKGLSNSSSSSNRNVDENTAAYQSEETHEMETHEMDENIASKMVTYITNEIDDANTNTCKKCNYIFPDNRCTTLIEHSLKEHQGDILANLISEGLLNDLRSSNRNADENTAASTSH